MPTGVYIPHRFGLRARDVFLWRFPGVTARFRAALAEVAAAVVTYNPDEGLAASLAALRAQIATVVVIDNASRNAREIERLALAAGCRFVGNAANLGVAGALNQAARLAMAEGFTWLASFDQDSLLRPGAIAGLLEVAAGHPSADRVAIVAMSHRDRATGRDYHHPEDILETAALWRSLRATITSGSLTRVSVFASVGLFDDKLFIDSVDHEFCLRCRRADWLVIEGRAQVLEHSIGAATEHDFFGRRIACTNHSPLRRYYITRNTLEVVRGYLLFDPRWTLSQVYYLCAGNILILMFESHRLEKFAAMMRGGADFLLRRFGPR
jgi:rhamnosyltransferase